MSHCYTGYYIGRYLVDYTNYTIYNIYIGCNKILTKRKNTLIVSCFSGKYTVVIKTLPTIKSDAIMS